MYKSPIPYVRHEIKGKNDVRVSLSGGTRNRPQGNSTEWRLIILVIRYICVEEEMVFYFYIIIPQKFFSVSKSHTNIPRNVHTTVLTLLCLLYHSYKTSLLQYGCILALTFVYVHKEYYNCSHMWRSQHRKWGTSNGSFNEHHIFVVNISIIKIISINIVYK